MTEFSPEAQALARVQWGQPCGDTERRVAQRAIDAGWVQRDDLVAQGWTPPPDPHEDIARALCNEAWPLTRNDELFAPETPSARLLAAVRRIPDDLARQVAEALRGES